jgi:hypothetical protein
VLEHEEAVGDWFEEAEERGLTRNDVSTMAAPCRRGLVDGGSVPWSAVGAARGLSEQRRAAELHEEENLDWLRQQPMSGGG